MSSGAVYVNREHGEHRLSNELETPTVKAPDGGIDRLTLFKNVARLTSIAADNLSISLTIAHWFASRPSAIRPAAHTQFSSE